MAFDLSRIIDEYFVQPLSRPGEVAPYNWVNTLVFAVIALLAAYLIYKGLKKVGVKIDREFYYSIIPFVLFGAAVRVGVDAQALPRSVEILGVTLYPFVTPLIYFLTFFVVIVCLSLALFYKKYFHEILRLSGSALFLLTVFSFAGLFKNHSFIGLILFLSLVGVAASEVLSRIAWRFFGKVSRSNLDRFTVLGHSLDGGATLVGVSFLGYGEQHVVANLIFGVGSPLLFYLIKVLFASVVVELFARELRKQEEHEQKTFLLLLVTIFGLAPGLRDALRIWAGV